jgi:hypothetical protein
MLQQHWGLRNYLKNLDSTDGLAAVCHFSILEKWFGTKSYSGWDAFETE